MSRPARPTRTAGFVAFLVASAAVGQAQVVYVDGSSPPGGDGASWATAFDDLQAAVAARQTNPALTEAWVAAGIYRPDPGVDRTRSFELQKSFAILGGFAGGETNADQRDPQANVTVLSGDLLSNDQPGVAATLTDNSYHVVSASSVDETAVLDGFTVRAGNADGTGVLGSHVGGGVIVGVGSATLRSCRFIANHAPASTEDFAVANGIGGAVFVENGGLVVVDCEFIDNSTRLGGGAIHATSSEVAITGCRFEGNTAFQAAALFVEHGPMTLVDCDLVDNEAKLSGAFQVVNTEIAFIDCRLENNRTTSWAGGAGAITNAIGTFVRCRLADNVAGSNAGGFAITTNDEPPAAWLPFARADLVDCELIGNQADDNGGAIYVYGVVTPVFLDVSRTVFRDNQAERGGAVYVDGQNGAPTEVVIDDSLFVDNSGWQLFSIGVDARPEVRRSTLATPGIQGTGAVRAEQLATTTLVSSIAWGEAINQVAPGNLPVTFSCVKNGLGPTNITADPQFRSYASGSAGDFALQPTSPCIDAGDPFDPAPELDVAAGPRRVDGDLDAVHRVDMGSDELDLLTLAADDSVGPGSPMTIATAGAPGFHQILVAGTQPGLAVIPNLGSIFVDLTAAPIIVAFGISPVQVTFPVPVFIPVGSSFTLQVAAFGPTNTVTNPATVTVE